MAASRNRATRPTPARESTATGTADRSALVEAELANALESIADLERALDDPGWMRLTSEIASQFTRDGLRRIAGVCRVMAVANPLIRRGLSLRTSYVWGQGINIAARANTPGEGQDVNAVVQAFLDDPLNRAAFTGQQASEQAERTLGTDGNLFVALFTNPRTGRVQVRTIPTDEIEDVISNPDDAAERWYYKRTWTRVDVDGVSDYRTDYYPDLNYRPARRQSTIGGTPVHWDTRIRHVTVNTLDGWRFGLPDAYTAIDWARAYKEFLSDWARLVKALSRFAWRLTSRGSKSAAAAQLRRAPSTSPTGANDAGATAVLGPDAQLEAIPKTGATIDSESGRPLAMMVAAALDVPVTMLLGDPGLTGSRATAETLDKPTELAMRMRRGLWTGVYRDLCEHVIREATRAPSGPLQGSVTRDRDTGRETLILAQDTDPTVDITWPDITDTDVTQLVAAITAADDTGYLPATLVLRLLLEALGVSDIDEILADVTDDQGRLIPQGVTAGQAAVAAFQRGEDPAQVV